MFPTFLQFGENYKMLDLVAKYDKFSKLENAYKGGVGNGYLDGDRWRKSNNTLPIRSLGRRRRSWDSNSQEDELMDTETISPETNGTSTSNSFNDIPMDLSIVNPRKFFQATTFTSNNTFLGLGTFSHLNRNILAGEGSSWMFQSGYENNIGSGSGLVLQNQGLNNNHIIEDLADVFNATLDFGDDIIEQMKIHYNGMFYILSVIQDKYRNNIFFSKHRHQV